MANDHCHVACSNDIYVVLSSSSSDKDDGTGEETLDILASGPDEAMSSGQQAHAGEKQEKNDVLAAGANDARGPSRRKAKAPKRAPTEAELAAAEAERAATEGPTPAALAAASPVGRRQEADKPQASPEAPASAGPPAGLLEGLTTSDITSGESAPDIPMLEYLGGGGATGHDGPLERAPEHAASEPAVSPSAAAAAAAGLHRDAAVAERDAELASKLSFRPPPRAAAPVQGQLRESGPAKPAAAAKKPSGSGAAAAGATAAAKRKGDPLAAPVKKKSHHKKKVPMGGGTVKVDVADGEDEQRERARQYAVEAGAFGVAFDLYQ